MTVNTEWTVSQSIRWRSELYSWRWRGSLDDGLWSMRPSGVQRSDKLPEAFKAYNTCRSSIGLYLGSKCRFVFRNSIYKNQHPSSHFLCFSQKIHCQSESVTCQRFVRSTHLPPTLIHSLFSSVNDSIRSIYFSFNFYSPYGKNLSFLHPSPLFYLKPVSLRFCHYV